MFSTLKYYLAYLSYIYVCILYIFYNIVYIFFCIFCYQYQLQTHASHTFFCTFNAFNLAIIQLFSFSLLLLLSLFLWLHLFIACCCTHIFNQFNLSAVQCTLSAVHCPLHCPARVNLLSMTFALPEFRSHSLRSCAAGAENILQ